MTHEYVVAVGGRVEPRSSVRGAGDATAIAWAADAVLAVGPDDVVRSISRGDSTFLDLGGCVVTALPDDLDEAVRLVGEATLAAGADLDIGELLADSGLLDPDSTLEPGSPADLAFWAPPTQRDDRARAPGVLVAVLEGGTFRVGDRRRGTFPSPAGD